MKASALCANAVKDDGSTYFKPYTIITRKGLKIAVIGIVEPKLTEQLPPQFWSGMTFTDGVEAAKKWIPIIKDTEKPDLIVGLFHAGVDYTYGGQNAYTPSNENPAQLIAEQVPGLDFVLVGHDHSGWDGQGWDPVNKKKIDVLDTNGKLVPIVGPTNAAKTVGKVVVTYTWDRVAKVYVKSIRTSLVPVEGVAADPSFNREIPAELR